MNTPNSQSKKGDKGLVNLKIKERTKRRKRKERNEGKITGVSIRVLE